MKGQNLNGKGTQPALQGVSETLFIPVWARAMETRRPDSLIQDTYALRIMGDHAGLQEKYRGAWLSQIGIIARTRALDRVASQFLASCPHGTVISLGCGLDARSRRLDNGIARWVDVDLPEVIAHRLLYFEDGPRHSSLSGSALGHGWIEEIAPPSNGAALIIAEGLLMYFSAEEVRGLLSALARRFPGAQFVFDVLGRRYVGRESTHDTVSKCSAPFRWGADSFEEIRALCPSLTLLERKDYFDCPRSRLKWVWFVRWLPYIVRTCQIFSARFSQPEGGMPQSPVAGTPRRDA